jgi:hypothetical protein
MLRRWHSLTMKCEATAIARAIEEENVPPNECGRLLARRRRGSLDHTYCNQPEKCR